MNINELCGASGPLPDGNDKFEVNNCPGKTNVFRYIKGIYEVSIRYSKLSILNT